MRPVRSPTGGYAIVALAASAGGIPALKILLGRLPAGFPVPVLLVQHLDPRRQTVLAEVLARGTKLSVKLAEHGERPRPGLVHVAPPGRHLTVAADGAVALSDAEPVHFVRPSADVLFESAARTHGSRVLACVLTGTGQDGADGVAAVRRHGGTVIVQDPKTAQFSGMPLAALAACPDALVLPVERIGAAMCGLVEVPGL
jgi:two-component system, chemotaxis family, protein-glutamate methylesterase/glutaminase